MLPMLPFSVWKIIWRHALKLGRSLPEYDISDEEFKTLAKEERSIISCWGSPMSKAWKTCTQSLNDQIPVWNRMELLRTACNVFGEYERQMMTAEDPLDYEWRSERIATKRFGEIVKCLCNVTKYGDLDSKSSHALGMLARKIYEHKVPGALPGESEHALHALHPLKKMKEKVKEQESEHSGAVLRILKQALSILTNAKDQRTTDQEAA